MEKKPIHTLQEIANWAKAETVTLPTVQRGFVWKPAQIENLWDSLLRGYPVGAFVLSHKIDSVKFEMLDGQQRATAICLGFGSNTFRDSQDKIKVFIDLAAPNDDDNRKYIFRVITKYHPWGYQRTDNTKTLTADNIRKALNQYDVDDHLEAALSVFYPFDATLPVPFHYFLNAAINNDSVDTLESTIFKSDQWVKLKSGWDEAIRKIEKDNEENPKSKKDLPYLSTEESISRRIQEIFLAVKKMLHEDTGQKIPSLYLDFEQYKKEIGQHAGEDEQGRNDFLNLEDEPGEDNDNSNDEIENLFIRLNAGGTPLRGEELNYSILKANIDSVLQNEIENACHGFMRPARFITIAYRLYQHQPGTEHRDALTMKIKPKQFQRTINEKKSKKHFSEFIQTLLVGNHYEGKTLLEYARHSVEYKEGKLDYGLPYLIVSNIAESAPEIMFMILYRIMIKEDRITFNTNLHRKMLGIITLFTWLGRGEKQRDHQKLLYNIWPCVAFLKSDHFWSASTVQRALLDDVMTAFPTFSKKYDKKSLKSISKYQPTGKMDIWKRFEQNTNHGAFLSKMFYNKELLIYAQRKFLSKVFKQSAYNSDDTNMPFDWDHLSPHRYVHRKSGIPLPVKDWYHSIGNLRAWPYALNRMDQDTPPAEKLNPLDASNYDEDDMQSLESLRLKWQKYIDKNNHLVKSQDELMSCLLDWSFCRKEWAACWVTDLKKDKDWKQVYHLIMQRNLAICETWYKELLIEDLMNVRSVNLPSIFDNRKWELLTSKFHDTELKKELLLDDYHTWISKSNLVEGERIYFVFRFSKMNKLLIEENNIHFSLYEKQPGKYIRSMKIPDDVKNDYYKEKGSWVMVFFTLISFEDDSYVELVSNFHKWLKEIASPVLNKNLPDLFVESLTGKYKSALKK